mgnify:CR=1 FL=1
MAAQTDLSIIIKAKNEAGPAISQTSSQLESLKKTGSTLLKGLAIAATGTAIVKFGTDAVMKFSEVGDAVEKMAKRTGLGAEAVSALRVAADMGGTSIDAVEASVKKMQIGMQDTSLETSALAQALEGRLAVGFADLAAMKPEEQFEVIGNAIASIDDPAERTRAAIDAFGKAGTDLIPMFEDGNFSMEQWSEEAKKLGVNFDDISASKAAALNDAVGKLTLAWEGFKLQLAEKLAPIITDFIENKLPKIIEGVDTFIDKTKEIIKWLKEHEEVMIIVAGAIVGVLVPAILGVLIPAIIGAGAAFIGMAIAAAPFLLAGAVIGGIVAGIWWLSKNWDQVTAALQAAWDVVAGAFASIAETIKSAVGGAFNWIIGKANEFIGLANRVITLANKIPGIDIKALPNIPPVPFAAGGIVTRPTFAMIGEAGPEAVIPLGRGGGFGGGGLTINIGNFFGGNPELAARELGDLIIKRLQLNSRIG